MKILVILLHGGDISPYINNIYKLQEDMKHNYSQDIVDYACITSSGCNTNYANSIGFKYIEINTNMQLSKMCTFITKYKDQLNYDWFIKIRPEIQLVSKINIDTLSTDCIHARAREYRGPRKILFGNSVAGEGEFIGINESFYSDTEEIIALDDQIYLFHRNIIDMGAFVSCTSDEILQYCRRGSDILNWEHEWTHSNCWKSRGIKLNVIGIDLMFTRNNEEGISYNYRRSGNINI